MQASELSRSVVSNALRPHGLQSARLLHPWSFPSKNTKVGCHFLFQGIFLTQGSNPRLLSLLHWQVDSWPLSHLGSPMVFVWEPTKTALEQHTCEETLYMTEVSLYIYEETVNILVQFSRSVMSDSLRPHESQHARPPCPSPTPRVHPDSHPSSQWCHPAISSSVIPYFSRQN